MCNLKTSDRPVRHGVDRRVRTSAIEAAELLAIAHMREARTLWSSRRIRCFVLSQGAGARHPGVGADSGGQARQPAPRAPSWCFIGEAG